MGLKRYITWVGFSIVSFLFILILILFLDARDDYKSLLRENINYKQDKYELIKKMEEIDRGIYLFKSRLDKFETLKKELINETDNAYNNTSLFLFSPSECLKRLRTNLNSYRREIDLLGSRLSYISTRGLFQDIPSIWPTNGWISSTYGLRYHPIYKERRFHNGIDIANSLRTSVVATASGVVTYV